MPRVTRGADAKQGAGANLGAFLRTELAATPGRGRASMRIVVACLVGTAGVMGFHAPHGDWIIWAILQVSGEDAGASLIKGIQRIVATLVGGVVGLLMSIAFADEPPFMFVSIGVVIAASMFLSRTASPPEAGVLVAFTTLLVVTSRLDAPGTDVDAALWRILMVLVGVVLGTGAQLALWPRDPEHRLLDEVAQRLATVEALFTRAATPDSPDSRGEPDLVTVSGFARELDLLANAEARYPSLRRRHTEQIALVTETERLLTNTLWLIESLRDPHYPYRVDETFRSRLEAMALACAHLRGALAARRPAGPDDAPYPVGGPADPGPGLPTLIASMEANLARVAAATGFLSAPPDTARRFLPRRSPLDSPARAPFLTPAFSLSNTDAMKFAMKCALAVEICILIPLGLDWPALLTAGITCLLVAQSTFGASVYKSVLRLAGAALGGLLGLLVIMAVMPTVESLAWILPPFAACFWIASWLMSGSSRISYVGVQAGYAFAIATLEVFGPTTDLAPPANRVLGVLLGIAVMGLVSHYVWPVRASRAMRPALAAALRAMSQLAEVERSRGDYASEVSRAARRRVAVYGGLAAALRLREESVLESGASAPAARAERDGILELAGDAQGVFLALLALARHRLETEAVSLPAEAAPPLAEFDRRIRDALQGIADAIEGKANASIPDMRGALEALERAESELSSGPSSRVEAPPLTRFRREVAIRRYIVGHVDRLAGRVLRRDA